MKQLDYNYIKEHQNQIYPHNSVSNYNKKRSSGLNSNPGSGYSNYENKSMRKTFSIYNANKSINPQKNYQNNENLAMKSPTLTNYYSYNVKKMNYGAKNSNQNISLTDQYSLKPNLQSDNHLNCLEKRNTYDSQSKNGDIKNIFHYNVPKINISGNDVYNNNNNYNKKLNKNSNIQNYRKISNEKNLLFYKLNSSKSTNELFYGDNQDIIIEYNNVPVINSRRNACNYKNSFSNDNINYIFQNSNYKKKNDSRNENHNNDPWKSIKREKKNSSNRIINYESYVNNSINKNRNLFNDNYFDIDLSNIKNNEENIIDDINYNHLLDNKKQFYREKQNKTKISSSYNPTLTSENQYKNDFYNNNYYITKRSNRNNNNNYSLSKIKNTNQRNIQKKNVNNNQPVNIINPKNSTLNNIKQSNIGEINSTFLIDNKALKNIENSILKKCNNSKKDILNNKEYCKNRKFNNPPKKNKASEERIKKINNTNSMKINKNLLSLYYSKSIIMNENNQKNDDYYEIYELQYTNNSNKKDNNKNFLNRQKKVLFKKDKANNSVDIHNKEKEKFKNNINLNSGFEKKNPSNKKSNLTECYNSPENINYLETRNHTSRLNNSKIIKSNYLIFSNDNINNEGLKFNNLGFKSSKYFGKKDKKYLNNLISERKIECNSPPSNNNCQYNSNKNKNKNNTEIIELNENNSKYNYQNNNQTKYISKLISSKKEENKNNKEISYKTENNFNTNNKSKKRLTNYNSNNNFNKNEESSTILKNINNNSKLKGNPVKLCFKNEEIKSNRENLKEKKEIINKNDNNNNNNHRNEDLSNKNFNNSMKIRKYNSVVNHSKKSKINLTNENKTNNKIININNNTSNVNVLNVKNSSINICIEKKDNINIISPSKNFNYASPSIQKKISNYKNNEINVKNVANELFENNHNLKNFNILKPKINKINAEFINSNNNPSNIKISTNTIRYNNLNINNNSERNVSNANALSKSKRDKNYNSNLNNIINSSINIKKKIIINKSKLFLYDNNKCIEIFNTTSTNNKNNKKLTYNLKEKTNNNSNKNKKSKNKENDIKYNDLKINNMNPIKTENQEKKNKVNYYKKINIPLISTNNSIQFNCQNNNTNQNQNSKGILYIKPSCILSKSKSKKTINKSKSELKLNNIIDRNNNYRKEIISGLKKSKKSTKSLNSEFFLTTPAFYQKDEFLKNNNDFVKRRSVGSLNASIPTKYISKDNFPDNENIFSYTNNNLKNNTIIKNIRDIYQKSYCFINKIYKYYIKPPKIEKCLFIKNIKNKNKLIKYKKENNKKAQKLIQDVLINNNDEEKNNESSQNGLIMTFGEMNNKRNNNEKRYEIVNNDSKFNNNIYEDSDLDIYKSLQQASSQNQVKNNKISFGYSSNINYSENEDLKIYESLEKEKNIFNDFNSRIYKSTNGKEIDEDFEDKKCKTFKKSYKLENAEKGLKILGKLVLRRGIKSNEESFNQNFHTEENNSSYKKNKNIYLGTNKLNELFNSRKETESSNNDKKNNYINIRKKKVKYSKSLNKDIAKGISKIENVFEKNRNELSQKKINTYEAKKKIYYDSNSKDNNYDDIMNFSEKIKPKIRTYIEESKFNLGSSNEYNTFDSCLELYNIRIPRYKESEIFTNKNKSEKKNSIEGRDSILPIKCNLLNDEIFNNCNDLLSYSEEDLKSFNYNINLEEYEKYLKEIKIKQSNNIIKHDIIFLLNILVENNYFSILNQITKLILYKNKDNILYNNDEIVKNEHLFKNSIFTHISRNKKFIFLYARICKDLNKNILIALKGQINMKNSKERNLKLIINDECISILNNFKKIDINDFKNKESDEYYYLRIKMIGFVTFIYELIKLEFFKQQFGFFILAQLYKIYIDNNNLDLYLEGILILLYHLGKLVFENNNIKYIENINTYIDDNCEKIFKNNSNNKIPNYLRYQYINLISKRNNNWEDYLDELLKKQEEDLNISTREDESKESINKINKIFNKEINIDEVNKSIIEEDLVNYISYYTEETNNGQTNIKSNIDKSYNWKIIEELVNNQNFGLESIINYFISVCTNIINDENQITISNDYIKNIIEYYANNLSKRAIDSIHNEMIKSFWKIDQLVNKNKNMYKILGNLLFILIDNKLYHIKYFNHYLKVEKQTQINLAIITKYCILSSGKFAKKYLNDFKQTKLFINNEIFSKYVNDALKDLLYFIK